MPAFRCARSRPCWCAAWEWLRRRPARPLRRILFVELSEMGTTVLAQPAMRRAREKLGAELFFVIFARNVGSIDLTGEFPAANVFTIRDTSLFHLAWDTLAFLVWTRRNGHRHGDRPRTVLALHRAADRICPARTGASAFTGFTTRACIAARC